MGKLAEQGWAGAWETGGVVFMAWLDRPRSALGGNTLPRPRPGDVPPTHLGVLVSPGELVEAVFPRVRLTRLGAYLEDGDCALWVRRPRGETPRSMEALARLASSLAGREFTRGGIAGQVFHRLRHSPCPTAQAPLERLFCGELAAALLLGTDQFRMKGLPRELLKKHPAAWTPEELDGCAGVWG